MAAPPFQLVATPNPSEFAIAVSIADTSIVEFNMLTSGVTTYAQAITNKLIPNSTRVQQFRNYVYTYMTQGGGYLTFYFAKPKTNEEKLTPFRQHTDFGDGPGWPPILLGVQFVQDRGFPRSTNSIVNGQRGLIVEPRRYVRYGYIPGISIGTLMTTFEYQAPTEFSIPRHRVPIPQSVQFDFGGTNKGEFPQCLHDDLFITGQRTGERVIDQAGNVSAGNGAVPGQKFPATNFTRWRPYVHSDKQMQRDGVWYRVMQLVHPPKLPNAVFSS